MNNFRYFFLGFLFAMSLSALLIDRLFVSKDIFKLKRIYIDGKFYEFCEEK
jgi:hypothetical protein